MKKVTKEMLENIILCFVSVLILICGCVVLDQGHYGKGVFYIMISLYLAMWIHAGLVGTIVVRKLEDRNIERS